jgi:AcrR family transcriptional regulator
MSGRRQEILDAAMTIADEKGLDAVSMRTVAERVGVTPMALYRHFDGKVALLDGMVERVVTSMRPSRLTGAWEERLTSLAEAYRGIARQHPWSAQLLFSRPSVTPDAARVTEFIYAALREAGVPEPHVGRMERLLTTFVIGWAASEVLGRFAGRTIDFGAEFDADLADLSWLVKQIADRPATLESTLFQGDFENVLVGTGELELLAPPGELGKVADKTLKPMAGKHDAQHIPAAGHDVLLDGVAVLG